MVSKILHLPNSVLRRRGLESHEERDARAYRRFVAPLVRHCPDPIVRAMFRETAGGPPRPPPSSCLGLPSSPEPRRE